MQKGKILLNGVAIEPTTRRVTARFNVYYIYQIFHRQNVNIEEQLRVAHKNSLHGFTKMRAAFLINSGKVS